jgi:hypothetical protein
MHTPRRSDQFSFAALRGRRRQVRPNKLPPRAATAAGLDGRDGPPTATPFECTATRSSNDPQIFWRRRRPDYHTISPNFQTILTFSQRDGDAMNCRALLLSSFLIAFATVSSAHEPKGHIDLDVVSNSPLPAFVAVCVSCRRGP